MANELAREIFEANCHQKAFDIVINLAPSERESVIEELRQLGCEVKLVDNQSKTLRVLVPAPDP
jgi:hypothetical protein